MASIILPMRLDEKLREKAEETGIFPEELGLEFVRRGLNEELDPEDLVEHYQNLSEKYLAEAKEFLSKGDLVQTSEKLWGATALTVKTIAAKRGLKLEKHGSLWHFVTEISEEKRDKDIIRFFSEANSLHRNFYENELTKKAIESMAEDIEELIAKLNNTNGIRYQ